MKNENKVPTRGERLNSTHEWIFSLIKAVLFAVILLAVFIAGCNISLNSFEKTYGNALVPRKNVEITIDDIKYAIDTEEMSDSERIKYIRSSIETLEAEIQQKEDK